MMPAGPLGSRRSVRLASAFLDCQRAAGELLLAAGMALGLAGIVAGLWASFGWV